MKLKAIMPFLIKMNVILHVLIIIGTTLSIKFTKKLAFLTIE